MSLSPRQRVEAALYGGHTDRVPFTIYQPKIPQCTAEREMRNRGLCIVERRSVLKEHHPNVKITEEVQFKNGRRLTRAIFQTPAGTLSTLYENHGYTGWAHEKMFKSPDDYKALLFYIEDAQYEPDYDAFAQAQKNFGEDAIFRTSFSLEPLQMLISSSFMDMEMFCIQWMENQDEILKLYDALVTKRREIYPLVAQSPAGHANYGGNVTPEIIGLETFEKYYVPHYNEAAEIMHKHDKLIGCHFDANCQLLSTAIAGTDLDYIEAFTPAPDTDMTLAQARQAWPDKVLWMNFPSSIHMQPDEKVTQTCVQLLDEVDTMDGLIMGVTEDMPSHRWQNSCRAIMDGLDQHAQLRSQLYS